MNILLVNNQTHYANWLPGAVIVDNLKDADLVLFEGGEDVDPSMYNEPKNPTTYSNIKRDTEEFKIFHEAVDAGIPILGICRGSQLACVASGGKLVQHQLNPGVHEIFYNTSDNIDSSKTKTILVNSTHHQAQYPFDLPDNEYKIIGWTENMLPFHEDGEEKEMNPIKECEIVYYPITNCLAIQFHPESMVKNNKFDDSMAVVKDIFNKFINKKL